MQAGHTVKGSCLCGSVSLTISELARDVIVCHCQQCRKQTGHVVAATQAYDMHITVEGEENLSWYAASASAQRGFCKQCGSLLMWKQTGTSTTSILAGCLEPPTKLNTMAHIFVDDKGDYYDIDDDIPQYQQSYGA